MEFKYKRGRPIVPVSVGFEKEIELTGVIDSGADFCTVPTDICELLGFKKIRDIELNIPGGTLIVPIFNGMIEVASMAKSVDIAGIRLSPKIGIDSLIGRNFFGNIDVHLLGKKQKLVIDI